MKFDILNITIETLKLCGRFYQKNKPRIFMITGLGLSATGTVVACKATYEHIDKIVDHHVSNMEAAEELPEEEVGKEKAKIMVETVVDLAKTYALPAVLSATGYGCIIYANHVQEQRQAILSDALSTLGAAYAAYRKRVEEKYGPGADEAILTNKGIAEVFTDDGKGNTKKEDVEIIDKADMIDSPFDKFFDSSSRKWEDDAEYNYSFLYLMEQDCNHILRTEGKLFLSDVYKKLDLPITKASLVAGWVYGRDDGNEISDEYVSFGLTDPKDWNTRRFVNGYENVVLLHFNCSSNIADYI